MKTRVFLITAKTNLHVGNESGGEFTIIDKAIQRDPLTQLPCINSSSLKGAIKQFCKYNASGMDLADVFGSDIDEKGKVRPETQKGSAVFFDAKLLYLPQQDNNNLFSYITSKQVIKAMNERMRLFVPGFKYKTKPDIDGHIVVVNETNDELASRCHNDNLPIIARNVLENGESKNLWYEQVLPAETILYTIIQENSDDQGKKNTLFEALNGQIVQIGAGATIGYGYCKFECIYKEE